MNLQNNLVITGGSGLVGSNFDSGIKLSSKEINLNNFDDSYEKIDSIKPKSIIHCAAKVGGLYHNMKEPVSFFNQNIEMNSNILKIAYKLNIEKFIGFLSTCIFPDNLNHPFTEKDLHMGPPHDSNFAYAYAKRMLDIQTKAYNKQFNRKYFCVIPTNIYGFNDNFNTENGHVIPSLIHKIFLAKIEKTNLTVMGTGKAKREFIFVKDLTRICKILLNKYNGIDPIIISNSAEEVSIKDVVEILVNVSNFKGKVIFDDSFSDGQLEKKTDTSKLKNLIGNYDFTPLESGIKVTYEWFENNYKDARK